MRRDQKVFYTKNVSADDEYRIIFRPQIKAQKSMWSSNDFEKTSDFLDLDKLLKIKTDTPYKNFLLAILMVPKIRKLFNFLKNKESFKFSDFVCDTQDMMANKIVYSEKKTGKDLFNSFLENLHSDLTKNFYYMEQLRFENGSYYNDNNGQKEAENSVLKGFFRGIFGRKSDDLGNNFFTNNSFHKMVLPKAGQSSLKEKMNEHISGKIKIQKYPEILAIFFDEEGPQKIEETYKFADKIYTLSSFFNKDSVFLNHKGWIEIDSNGLNRVTRMNIENSRVSGCFYYLKK